MRSMTAGMLQYPHASSCAGRQYPRHNTHSRPLHTVPEATSGLRQDETRCVSRCPRESCICAQRPQDKSFYRQETTKVNTDSVPTLYFCYYAMLVKITKLLLLLLTILIEPKWHSIS